MRRRLIHRRKYQNFMKEYHDEAVKKIAEKPEILGIEGLSSETLIIKPLEFPELKKRGQETGDLIFLYSPHAGERVISVIEVQVATFRSGGDAISKLKMTRGYLMSHWREWFRNIGLELPRTYSLWIETIFVSYAGKTIYESPWVERETKQIL